ncbi:MAG: acyltransferase [Verrucomicrobiales bacterium]|nr:acyltransferase [Verrucomicrobiales bacterium]
MIADSVTLEDGVRIEAWKGGISIAENVHLGSDTKIYGHGGVSIGSNTLIAMNCCILSSDHTICPQGTPIRTMADVLKPTEIGSDVWLGAGVIVLGGVTIGDGAVIGAGSVVTHNISKGAICVGTPAKPIRQREKAS